jgi:type II secretory pathway component GspD/PulD (secretin)
MELSSVHEFHQIMENHNLIITYDGEFNQDVIKNVLSMTERNLNAEGIDSGVLKKVYNVMVEALQNVCKHQHVEGFEQKGASFMIGEDETNFFIVSSNPLQNNQIKPLRNRLDTINSKDKEGLKQLYKEARLNSTISKVGGAGLGFIDMARKSENKLYYSFDKLQIDVSYFTIMCKISKQPTKD